MTSIDPPAPRNPPDPRDLLRSLMCVVCPACGGHKKVKKSLCRSCFNRLPGRMKQDLYQHFGDGYEAALRAALEHLNVDAMHLPEEVAK